MVQGLCPLKTKISQFPSDGFRLNSLFFSRIYRNSRAAMQATIKNEKTYHQQQLHHSSKLEKR